ncbi:metal-nicotianamine transporter YSL3 isoform X2 [Camellia sinensis]|uniref:metal-nicotianamine transporter YSL3 isoform X2 n=1 Tax=Camellia sinensis TaxID=4442 RepID=UPI00103554B6|nr:metal-nicotianamine transporter YSL3 isoform X2 [Camellia sinensis]
MNTESEPNEKREIEKVDNTEAVVDEIDDVSKRIPPWTKQVTVRGVIASIVIGCVYSVIAMKLNLTTGLTPHLNVSAALLAFIFMRAWTKLLGKAGIVSTPFTRQENTMIQTCSVACYTIAVGGGFGSYLLALNKKTYEQTGVNTVGNSPGSYKEPGFGWMTGFLFVVCFIGLFVLIPLRKILIVDYKLTFPSGMATAVLINGFHNQGEKMARFYFDFSMTYVGTGMICPHIVNLSTLLGAVLSWGVMWPLLANFKGLWFPSTIPESSMKSLNGYKVFLSIALLLGDGIYNFIKVICITFLSIHGRLKQKNLKSAAEEESSVKSLDILKQNEVFIRESIPLWVGASGYILFTVISVIVIPFIFPEVKWYYVIMSYLLAPSLAFCNAYGAGLTDINMSYNYGKVGLFALAALAGKQHGVVAGLAGCGLMKSVISVSCILMQDLKTGHLTLTSPRTMLVSQAIGTAIGCVVSPLCFLLFYKAFDVGNPNGEYKAPYAVIYRNIAILGVQGFSALPYHCLQLCYGFFAFAVGINLVKDFSPPRIGKWMPLPMAMAVPFLVGAYFSIDMCVGTLIVFVWHKLNPKKAELMVPVVASGLICGEGLWTLPASILSLAGVNPPMCMKFLAS